MTRRENGNEVIKAVILGFAVRHNVVNLNLPSATTSSAGVPIALFDNLFDFLPIWASVRNFPAFPEWTERTANVIHRIASTFALLTHASAYVRVLHWVLVANWSKRVFLGSLTLCLSALFVTDPLIGNGIAPSTTFYAVFGHPVIESMVTNA